MRQTGVQKLKAFSDPDLDRQIEELIYYGRAGWRDEKGDLSRAKASSSSPTWAVFQGGVYAWQFADGAGPDQALQINLHIDHNYMPGSLIYPHIHWQNNGVDTGVVRWGVEMSIAKGHGQQPFSGTTTYYIEQAADGNHQIAELSDAQAFNTDIEPDTILLTRVFRDRSHVNDTCTDAVFALYADIHFLADRLATNDKAPDFYGHF